eukprot:XP_011610746.1 PREDICTED: lysine-rich nucleolar protein 1 [Takifugu rubripes]
MTEEKKLKKVKKNKNEKASLQKNNCVNDRILTVLCQEKESCVQADEKAGKKKKEKYVNECLFNTTNGGDISKKKKKKKKQDSDYKIETPLCKIKDNKKRKKSTCADLEHVEIDEKEELPKKVKKKKNAETVEWAKEKKKNTADEKTSDAIEEKHSKKHKKSPQIVAEDQETTEETGDSEGVKKSKMALKPVKNKKVKTREHGNKVTAAEIKDDVKKKKENPAKSDHMKEEKKKPKKTALECADVEEPQLRQKKKSKKRSVQDEAEPPLVNSEEQQSEEKLTGTGRKKKRKERTTMVDAPAEHLCSGNAPKPKKTKKVKEEVEDQNELSQMDVVFLSVKNGNTDEVTINQERRRALQTENDQASRPQIPASPSGLGQWSTAQFDSSEKQQKFLRLMGGFKKGFQPATTTATGANMALGTHGQQQLQQKLLDEFDRAHSRRLDSSNRGAGIGFTAPVNKKFFIDVNASRSVRFDD